MERLARRATSASMLAFFRRHWQPEPSSPACAKRALSTRGEKFEAEAAALGAKLARSDSEAAILREQMEQVKRESQVHESGNERLQAELESAYRESAVVRQHLKQIEDELTEQKQINSQLNEQLNNANEEEKEAETDSRIAELEAKIEALEKELSEVKAERDRLTSQCLQNEKERREEMKIIQEALETAQKERVTLEARFSADFERLRTVNTDREQQLLDDFEWKLREVEQTCKRRLDAKEAEIVKLRGFQTEIGQLRSLNLEQQRSLREAARHKEELQVSERILKEEITRWRAALEKEKNTFANMQDEYERKLSDLNKEMFMRLDQQKNKIILAWEERLQRDRERLRSELEEQAGEEQAKAVSTIRRESQQALAEARRQMNEKLEERDAHWERELDRARTNADADLVDLRRKLDKAILEGDERLERAQAEHEKRLESVVQEWERKTQQLEQSWQMQNTSTRTTLELVKEQMEREAQSRLEDAEQRYQQKLENLMEEHKNSLRTAEESHRQQIERIKEEFEIKMKSNLSKEKELTEQMGILQSQMAAAANGSNNNSEKAMMRAKNEANQRLRDREAELRAQHAKQLQALNTRFESRHAQAQREHEELSRRCAELTSRLEEIQAKEIPPVNMEKSISSVTSSSSTSSISTATASSPSSTVPGQHNNKSQQAAASTKKSRGGWFSRKTPAKKRH